MKLSDDPNSIKDWNNEKEKKKRDEIIKNPKVRNPKIEIDELGYI